MKQAEFITRSGLRHFYMILLAFFPLVATGQQNVIINMAPIDGVPITPDNIFNYQVQCSGSGNATVNGTIRYRNSNLSISYTFNCSLRQGINILSSDFVHAQWQFSSSALQTLFFTYKILPEGTYEYCVTITPSNRIKEPAGGAFDECLYHREDDIFLINLIDPTDKEKLIDYNPPLAWMANYSFSNELTYRLRVAPIKQGQNAANAVLRNQSVFDESNLVQNSIVYPVYATPLITNQWYAWMVNAYFQGILLGSSEAWQFIIPDSLPPVLKASRSHIDIKRENGSNKLFAVGDLKLKYVLDDAQKDSLYLELDDVQDKKCPLKPDKLIATYGDNRYDLNLADSSSLKHLSNYTLKITTKTKHDYKLSFQYINPNYQH